MGNAVAWQSIYVDQDPSVYYRSFLSYVGPLLANVDDTHASLRVGLDKIFLNKTTSSTCMQVSPPFVKSPMLIEGKDLLLGPINTGISVETSRNKYHKAS